MGEASPKPAAMSTPPAGRNGRPPGPVAVFSGKLPPVSRRFVISGSLLAAAGIFATLAFVRLRSASAEAHDMVQKGAVLLDVRTAAEFQAGHLPGAINIPVAELAGRAAEVGPPTRAVVTYCKSGARSTRAAAMLRQLGFTNVLNLGPKAAW
jgi:rhodanese-related sulfurtransferase